MKDIYKQNPLNPTIPKYCDNCGAPVILGRRKVCQRASNNGQPVSFEYTARCSTKKSVINFITLGWHSVNCLDQLIIETPDDNITNKPHRTILVKGF